MADMTPSQRNALNQELWKQPWYRDWYASKGKVIDGRTPVRLTGAERAELSQVMAAHGMPLSEGLVLDSSGNVNAHHGWAGLPTWAKVAIIGGAAVATAGAAGAFGGAAGGVSGAAGSAAGSAGASGLFGAGLSAGLGGATGGGLAATGGGTSGAAGRATGGAAASSGLSRLANQAATSTTDRLLNTAITGLAGLPGLNNNGPSDAENALTEQARQILQSQQQRQTYQDPLYKAVTQMAFDLLPKRSGSYPGGA